MKKCAALVFLLFLSVFPEKTETKNVDLVQTAALTWASERDVMSGECVICRSLVAAGESGDSFSGYLSRGLTFERVTKVIRNGETVNAALYTVVTARQREGAAFTIHLSSAAAGETLTIEYVLRVNDDAGEENRFTLARSGEEPREGGCLRLFSLCVFRGVQVSDTGQTYPVSGSCLCLTRDTDGHDRVAFRQKGDDTYLACTAEECGHARHLYVMKTPRNGIIRLEGIPQGIYYLRETRPCEGTVTTADPLEITVAADGSLFCGATAQPDGIASMIHCDLSTGGERRFSLLEFYRRGIRLMVVILCVALGIRRYSL